MFFQNVLPNSLVEPTAQPVQEKIVKPPALQFKKSGSDD
jgi:hypothetical protein